MKGTEKIIAHIEAEANDRAKEILKAADAEVEAIKAESAEQSQKRYWELVHSGAKEYESYVSRAKSTAEMETKKSVLALKQELLSKAFEKAKEHIVSMPKQDYVEFLAALAFNASRDGLEELVFNERDKAEVSKSVAKLANEKLTAAGKCGKLTVSEEIRDICGGLILRQGGIEANCSVEALVFMQRSSLSADVAGVLFE